MKELVSIITPMFNSIKYIEATIMSVQAQTYQNWEMIIIDDGSTDGSVKIVKSFSEKDERINGLELTKYLKNYASIGEKYVAILENIIDKNSLTDFDQADLLPTKLKQGVAL